MLGQLALGHTDREIAESFYINKKTVSIRVSNLLRKLDEANRVEAGRIGQEQLVNGRNHDRTPAPWFLDSGHARPLVAANSDAYAATATWRLSG